MVATLMPRAFRMRPIDATVTPLPRPERTPPVTKIYLLIFAPVERSAATFGPSIPSTSTISANEIFVNQIWAHVASPNRDDYCMMARDIMACANRTGGGTDCTRMGTSVWVLAVVWLLWWRRPTDGAGQQDGLGRCGGTLVAVLEVQRTIDGGRANASPVSGRLAGSHWFLRWN